MAAYRKRPVVIEAVQWDGQNRADLVEFVGDSLDEAWSVGGYCFINTLEGRMNAAVGDWIIRGVQGEFYPCKPDIFEATYELVEQVRETDSPFEDPPLQDLEKGLRAPRDEAA